MAKKKRQNLMEREKSRKGDGTISNVQLISCYASSVIIVALCVLEAMKPETIAADQQGTYYILAVLGIAFSLFITLRNRSARKKAAENQGPRLK